MPLSFVSDIGWDFNFNCRVLLGEMFVVPERYATLMNPPYSVDPPNTTAEYLYGHRAAIVFEDPVNCYSTQPPTPIDRNVRELANVIERAIIDTTGTVLLPLADDLGDCCYRTRCYYRCLMLERNQELLQGIYLLTSGIQQLVHRH